MLPKSLLKNLLRDTQGATAIEYGLILALIAIAMITAMQSLANSTNNMWGNIESEYEESTSAARS